MSYRVQVKTSWRWAPYKVDGRIFICDDARAAQKVADGLHQETGYETRVVEVV